jgi:hypothetical protein
MIQFMDGAVPVPLFRTGAQYRVLGELYTNPGLEATVGALAERLRVPQATVSREVARLADAGLVRTRREGNRTLVAAALDASIAPELQSLLGKLYGPRLAFATRGRPSPVSGGRSSSGPGRPAGGVPQGLRPATSTCWWSATSITTRSGPPPPT